MPIDFPNNPSAGQTYSFNNQEWVYNGVAWDKIVIADDANALYGISGSIYASSLATGLLYGGILSINAGNSAHFDITAGRGQIHAAGSTYTANPQPTLQYVTWAGQTGITLTYLATNDTTWIYIDSAGNLQQRTEYYTDDQLEENIIIGQLVHPSRTFINLARTNPNVAYATDKQYEQFIRSFGPIKISGHTIQPNGANLKLNRTSGSAFSLGRNWINDTDNPSVVSDGAYTDCIFYRYYRGATAGTFITVPNQTVIDPTNYDDGTGTLASVPGGKYTIQRLFYYPNTPTLLGVYYGRAQYTSLADAAANINFENFTEIENTRTNAIFVAYLLIKSGCTDITNTSDALILQAGNFRSTTSGGGSVSLTLDDLTDVIITSPQNNQVLTYVDGVTGWENRSVSTLPLVSSIRGLTGAVGITNGSGIGLSVSGQTMTFSNTGVLSINGGTGAITNVARTNVDNNFTASQTITAPSSGAVILTLQDSSASEMYFIPGTKRITAYDDLSGNQQTLQFDTTANNTVTLPSINTTLAGLASVQTFTDTNTFNVETRFPGGISAAGATFSSLVRFNAGISSAGGTFSSLVRFNAGISAAGGTFSGTQTFINGATFTGNISAPNIVNSVRGLTGVVGITNGSGIGLSVSGQTMTFSNTGVLSIDGGTGAITNVARTNVSNIFTANQLISAPFTKLSIVNTVLGVTSEYSASNITHYSGTNTQTISFNPTNPTNTITLPNVSTTLAGLAAGQTFTQVNTFNALTNFPGGISAAGATFSGDIAVNGGDITTTSTSASLFNANATTLNILNTQSSGFTLNIGSATTYSGTKNINIGGNVGGGAGENISIGGGNSSSKIRILGGITLGGVGGAPVTVATPSEFVVESTSTVNGIATFNGQGRFTAGISAAGGTFSGTQTFINGATFTGIISAPNIVNSVRGLTGAVGITNGSGIGLSVSGQTMTFSNTGVLSIDGGTGAITNVARTNVANNFTALQSFSSGISSAGATFTGDINLNSDIYHKTDNNSSFLIQQHYSPAPGVYSPTTFINLGVVGMALGYTGSGNAVKLIGGLEIDGSSTSIFTNHTPLKIKGTTLNGSPTQSMTDWINPSNTVLSSILPSGGYSGPASSFSGLVSANAGISAAGATFSSLVRFNAGISAAGGTFGNAISVNGFYETANSIRVTNNARSWFL